MLGQRISEDSDLRQISGVKLNVFIEWVQFFVIDSMMRRRSSLPGSGLSNRKSSRSATVKTPQIMIGQDSTVTEERKR